MKEIKQISLNGMVFHVEEDGYLVLQKYINNLERYYATKESGKEIIDDIQIRFAELLLEKKTYQEQAITLAHVEEVIAIMGYPENFEPGEEEKTNTQTSDSSKKYKRLYRDPENARLAGVCSGLGYYFGIDAWLFRLLFIILGIFSFGTWLFIYIVMWFIIPKAESTMQRYEMKGEALNIGGIEQKIKDEFEFASKSVKNFAKKNSDNFKTAGNEISSTAGNVFNVLGKIFGVFLIFFSISSIVIVLTSWFFPISSLFLVEKDFSIFCGREIFAIFGLNNVASVLALGCVLLPLIMLLTLGISFFTPGFRKKLLMSILGMFITWIILCAFVGIGITSSIIDRNTNHIHETSEIKIPSNYQSIYIKPNNDSKYVKNGKMLFGHRLLIKSDNNKANVYGIVKIDDNIVYTNDSNFVIQIEKESSKKGGIEEIPYTINVQDSIAYITPIFPLKENYWGGEKVTLQFFVPKGKEVIIDKEFNKRKYKNHHRAKLYIKDDNDEVELDLFD